MRGRLELDRLREAPLLSALGDHELTHLVSNCRRLQISPNSQVFSAGQPADAFFVVLGGSVKVYKLSARGDEQILHHYGPGATFGEAAVLSGGVYPAFAETLEPSILLQIERTTLLGAIEHNPELALAMLGGLSAKLREFARLVEQLALKEVPARLADVLLEMSRDAGSDTFELGQTKRQLAAQIGTVAETLSRALKKLRVDGLIDVQGSKITVLDSRGLRNLAEHG
ncbi:Crp/Fnr family transcriptional regulator [Myxococcota bacterium]